MSDVRVVPLLAGTGPRDATFFLTGAEPDPIDAAFTIFYIESRGKRILIDTGFGSLEQTHAHHYPLVQEPGQHPVEALAGIGVAAEEIDIVVNTHLHWDHCGGNDHFPNAKILVQRSEMAYAVAPEERHRRVYDEVVLEEGRCVSIPNFLRARLTAVEGDLDLTEDVRLIHTPGHTPGSQSVLVRGQETYLLAGDNVPLYDNLNGGGELIPITSCTDFDAYMGSMKRALGMSTVTLPSHDHRVFDTAVYR